MKYKKVLVGSLLCIMLSTMIIFGAWALLRISMAYNYATQYAAAAAPPPTVTSGTNLSLLIYGDPEPIRPTLNLFQYVTAQNIEWRGSTILDPQGNPISINVKITSVKFAKLNENNYNGNVTGLNVRVDVGDLFNVFVKADKVDVNMTFWTYMDMFPALNITGVLTGNVEVSISVAVLPLFGIEWTVYQFKGDQFIISLCSIKPMDVIIEKPSNGERVSGDVKIQALVKAVPALTVNVQGWIFEKDVVQMQYNETSGLWEGVLKSYNVGNGKFDLNVRAEGVEWKGGQQFKYADQDRINVEINNPWVNSYVQNPDGSMGCFGGLEIKFDYEPWHWSRGTGFNFWPWIGLNLSAPEYWSDGKIRFNCWKIDDEYGNMLFQSSDPTLTITPDVFGTLFDGEGRARELKCIYSQVPQP